MLKSTSFLLNVAQSFPTVPVTTYWNVLCIVFSCVVLPVNTVGQIVYAFAGFIPVVRKCMHRL